MSDPRTYFCQRMQPAIYRKLSEVVERYRIDPSGRREVWVRRFFEALDWGGPAAFSIDSNEDGFSLSVDKCPVINVIIEKPSAIEPVYRGLNRAYNQDVPWVVATDFNSFGLFGSYWVSFQHDVSSATALKFEFSEYLLEAQNFELLTPDAVAHNRIDELYRSFSGRRKRLPIDIHLVERMSHWRQLALESLGPNAAGADASIYQLINALFLVRYMEDSKVIPVSLKGLAEEENKEKCASGLRRILSQINQTVGYRVPTRKDLDKLNLVPLRSLLRDLYGYPELGIEYDFAAMSVDVLGRFYEEYLQSKPEQIQKKPNREDLFIDISSYEFENIRRKRGIYYTPRYLVDYIVSNLVTRHKAANPQSGPPAILDLAVGSGTFLTTGLDQLFENYSKTDPSRLIGSVTGLDIDERAIEAARLNLTAKFISKGIRENFSELRLKCFDLLRQGPEASELRNLVPQDGFDIIVGNPPYIQYEKLAATYPLDSLQANFEVADQRVDSYMLFVEAAVDLLKLGGLCGLVLPNGIIRSKTASRLREWLAKKADLLEMVDFLDQPVFKSAAIYVCILLFRKKSNQVPSPQTTVVKVFHLSNTPSSQLARVSVATEGMQNGYEVFQTPQPSGPTPWVLRNRTEIELVEFIKKECVSLKVGEVEIRQGIKTGLDEVFLVQTNSFGKGKSVISDNPGVVIENELLLPVFRNRDLRRWNSRPSFSVIYPYDLKTKRLLPWKTIEQNYPGCATYLKAHKDKLAKRKSLRGKEWYALIEPRLATVSSALEMLFIAEMSFRPSVSSVSTKATTIVGGAGGGSWILFEKNAYQKGSLMAYLNSIIAEWFLRQVSTPRRGGWLLVESQALTNLPIPKFLKDKNSFANNELERLTAKIAEKLQAAVGAHSASIRREVQIIEDQIDSIIIETLGLTSKHADYIRSRVSASRGAVKTADDQPALLF